MSAETRLDDLLQRWEELRERGESPTPEEVCRDDPHLLGAFRRELVALLAADQALQSTRTPPGQGPTDPVAGPADPAWEAEKTLHSGAEPVPGYRLVAPLGRGSFGEVWKAEGPGGFPLALKFVRLVGPVGEIELRSLEVLKSIRHPNLLGTVGAWEVGPRLVIAMELADRTLGDRLREVQDSGLTGIPGPELLEYIREAAKGIDFLNEPRHALAGKSGVRMQHRDVKPANILLVGTGVKVADFGLIKLLEQSYASHDGALTPAFAAPEFFDGQTSPHSDQYSLAVTYCQLRGGRLPFVGSMAELLNGHVNAPPDLTMLPEAERAEVARALAKRPSDRWPSCRAFVEALARVEQTLPAAPPPPTRDDRPPRHPWLAKSCTSLFSAALLLAVALLAPSGKAPVRPNRPLAPPVVHHDGASPVKNVADLPSAPGKAQSPDLPVAATKVGATRPDSIPPGEGAKEVEAVRPVRFAGHGEAVRCVAWHPGGELVASGGDDGTVRIWNRRSAEQSQGLIGHQGPVNGLAISPDGNHLLTGGLDKTVRYWDLSSGRALWKKAAHDAPAHCVAISPDGLWGLSASQDMSIRLWDLREGRESALFETDVESYSVSFTADGRHFLMAGDSPVVHRLRWDTGERVGQFDGHHDVVWSVACASGSDWAASGGGDSNRSRDYLVRVWKSTDRRPWHVFEGHTGAVGAVAISPDGRYVLSGGADGTVRLWDCKTGQELRCFRDHRGHVSCVGFSPDVLHAVSGGLDGVAFVWTLNPTAD